MLCLRRLLRVSWTARRSNQSILKEINPEYSLKGMMLKLKFNTLTTWCEEPTHWKRPWCWERLRAGREEGGRRWYVWVASPIQWTWTWQTPGYGEGQGGLGCCYPWGRKKSDISLCPCDFPGKNTEVDCHSFSRGSSRLVDENCLLQWQVDLYCWANRAAPYKHHHV